MEKANVRIRPLRFAFALDPDDLKSLSRVFEANSLLWGGQYNFILPLFKRVPKRYKKPYDKEITASRLINGLIEAFQPDFIVEVESGSTANFRFPRDRVITLGQLFSRDPQGRCLFGVDVRTLIADVYEKTFRFVQRHPPQCVIPSCSDARYELLFAAMFGILPESGPMADCAEHFLKALDGKRQSFAPAEYIDLLSPNHHYLFPMNLAATALETRSNSWSSGPALYYMDERSALDLIDYWNLSALGWHITPLPSSLAPQLTGFCAKFIESSYQPYPPPSNAFYHATFLCSPNCSQTDLERFISSLPRDAKNPAWSAISLDTRVPRIWEEWGRSADHAEPQTVTHRNVEVETSIIGDSLHLDTAIPDFLEDDEFASPTQACVNVLQSVPGGAPVIPWGIGELTGLLQSFADDRIWVSHEGIVTTSAQFSVRFLHSPTALNVFSAFTKGKGFKLSLSPAGNVCKQLIKALGGIRLVRIVARSAELLRFLNSLAHEEVEVESETNAGKKVRKPYAPYTRVLEIVSRSTSEQPEIARSNFFNALVNTGVLTVGLALRCKECVHTSWHSLTSLAPTMRCPRCLSDIDFPSASPPRKEEWAYKISGPFAASNFAQGAYCVASTLHLLTEKILDESITWIPSFRMRNEHGKEIESDFGIFARPSRFSNATLPFLVLGECKSFSLFESDDFDKAHYLADLLPGTVICFATFRENLTSHEKRELAKIVRRGRVRLRTGRIRNPVLIVTGKELFSQFSFRRDFYEIYGERAQYAHHAFIRRDIEELCDFSQQVHLGIESYHDWLTERRNKKASKRPLPPGEA